MSDTEQVQQARGRMAMVDTQELPQVAEDLSAYIISGAVRSKQDASARATEFRTPAQGIDDGVAAERLGFRRVWMAERWDIKHSATVLSGVAARTSRIGVGAGVIDPTAHHPVITAAYGATMHCCYGPRFVLGLGRGVAGYMQGSGIAMATYRQMADYIKIVRALWRGETVHYDGPVGRFEALAFAETYDGPDPEIWFAGIGQPKGAQLVAECCDGILLPTQFTPEATHDAVNRIRDACTRVGRDPSEVRICQPVVTAPGLDEVETRAVAHGRAVTYLQTGLGMSFYPNEVRFYQEIADSIDVNVPRCFYAEIETADGWFTAVMDDRRNASPGNMLDAGTPDDAAAALRETVALQAGRWDDPQLREAAWLQPTSWIRFAETFPDSLAPFLERFGARMTEAEVALCERVISYSASWLRSWSGPVVIQHGDYRPDNVLFGPPGERPTVFDWATIRVGPPYIDPGNYIVGSLTRETRRAHEEELLRGYHDGLVASGVEGYDWRGCWEGHRCSPLYASRASSARRRTCSRRRVATSCISSRSAATPPPPSTWDQRSSSSEVGGVPRGGSRPAPETKAQPMTPSLPHNTIVQVAFVVENFEAAMSNYARELKVGGWVVMDPATLEGTYRGEPMELTLQAAIGYSGEMAYELICQTNDTPSLYRELIDATGFGFHHVATVTDDVDAEVTSHRARGHSIGSEIAIEDVGKAVMVDAHPVFPGWIEIIEAHPAIDGLFDAARAASASGTPDAPAIHRLEL
jgi:5,10-methylenetetrahydromethanopterin reductase